MSVSKKPVPIVIGIDFGNSTSCVAVYRDSQVHIIPNERDNRTTSSCVAFNDTERLIGDAAKAQSTMNPYNTVTSIKRVLGRKWADMEYFKSQAPFRIVEKAGKPHIQVEFRGEVVVFAYEQIAAMVISKMKLIAEVFLSATVSHAVITVPATFNLDQRQAVKDAGVIAGLNVVRLVDEADAAAIAYCVGNITGPERTILIFDYGSDSLNVSVVKLELGIIEVLSTHCSFGHCGQDFNRRLVSNYAREFLEKHKKDLTRSVRALCRLRLACERAKFALSSTARAEIELESLYEGIDLYASLTRERFEYLCQDLFTDCLRSIERVLRDAKVEKTAIENIVLLGGSSRIPKVQKLLSEFFNGKELNKSLNYHEAVAYGAAIQGYILSHAGTGHALNDFKDLLLLSVQPFTIGIGTSGSLPVLTRAEGLTRIRKPLHAISANGGSIMTTLIKRNSTIPTTTTEMFSTFSDSQSSMLIEIVQGELPRVKENRLLCTLALFGIPRAPQGVPLIEVTVRINLDSLSVSVVELGSNRKLDKTIVAKNSLSKEAVEQMMAQEEIFKAEDKAEATRIAAMNNLEAFTFSLKELRIDGAEDENMSREISKAIDWLDNNRWATQDEYEHQRSELEAVLARSTTSAQDLSTTNTHRQPEQSNSATDDPDRGVAELEGLDANLGPGAGVLMESGEQIFDFLRNNPQFQYLRKLVQEQPEMLRPILKEIKKANPQFAAIIEQNRGDFLQLLSEDYAEFNATELPLEPKPRSGEHLHGDRRSTLGTDRKPTSSTESTSLTDSSGYAESDVTEIPLGPRTRSVEQRLGEYFLTLRTESNPISLTDSDLQQISSLLRNTGHLTWSSIPRIYTILRHIGYLQSIDTFIDAGITDIWFPFTTASLPDSLTPSIRANFINAQSLVITKALEFEKDPDRKHAHFGPDDIVPFEVKARLGSGGAGYVEKVVSLLSHREYARKSFRRRKTFSNQREDIKSFRNELQAFKRISHIHCVELIGSYTDPKYFALIMSPVADCDLAAYYTLAAGSADKLSLLRGFFGCLANALQYLHASQIRHRDIKPQNILVKGPNVFLTDFGIALDWGSLSRSTTTEDSGKTWVYAAPEVAQFSKRNSSTDVWSLGCVFLEMATVLKGEKLSAMRDLFKSQNDDYRFYNNIDPSRDWMSRLAAPNEIADTAPWMWIVDMLQETADKRPTAFTLYSVISSDGGTPSYCGPCCRDGNESSDAPDDDGDDPWAEDTVV